MPIKKKAMGPCFVMKKAVQHTLKYTHTQHTHTTHTHTHTTQVYKAELRGSGVQVAVKVQRPNALATISKGELLKRLLRAVLTKLTQRKEMTPFSKSKALRHKSLAELQHGGHRKENVCRVLTIDFPTHFAHPTIQHTLIPTFQG